jgi:hypothetical protein
MSSDKPSGAGDQQERLAIVIDVENPQRPYAGPLPSTRKRMRWSGTRGDAGSWNRAPALVQADLKRTKRFRAKFLVG